MACAKLEARDNLNKGVRAFKSGDFEGAAKLFKTASELDPNLQVAEIYLATSYFKMFEKDSADEVSANNAIETFEKVLTRTPGDSDAVAGIAAVYQRMKRFDKAREYYMKQTQLKVDDASAFYAIASIDWTMASPGSGAYSPEDPPPVERQMELVDEGLQYADKALSIDPDHEDAQNFKNLLFREKARLSEKPEDQESFVRQADEWFEKAKATRKRNAEKSKQAGIIIEQK
jgi:tetratricopeptide (TPR) repeat protein